MSLICPLTGSIIQEPSTLPCNHVFEKEALEDFLKTNKNCPVCGPVLPLKLNFQKVASLKLKAYKKVSGLSTRTKQPKLTDPLLEKLSYCVQTDGNFYNLKITAPDCVERRPILIVAVIDISGSMGTTVGPAEGGKAFTRLDLVKHVLNVLIESLNKDDYLSLIAFSDETEVLLQLCEMNEKNKKLARKHVTDLSPTNGTYTTKAIKEAYRILENGPQNYINSILLLTDGVDSDGEDYLRQEFDCLFKQRDVQFNTFGFSSDIWSHVLQELALKANGVFGYIPDQTMIGTIFINFLANTLLTYDQGIYYEIDDNYELVYRNQPKKFSINFGQSRNFLVIKKRSIYCEAPSFKIWKDLRNLVKFEPLDIYYNVDLKKELARSKIIQFALDTRLPNVPANNYEDSVEINALESFKCEFIKTNPSDVNQQQLKLSLSYWNRWGAHYIRSFVFSHLYELCLNFKSPSMQRYKTPKFEAISDELTDLFCTIQPPEPTGYIYAYDDSTSNGSAISMSNLMDPNGGCILDTCRVQLYSGEYIPIGDLRKGQILSNGATVICLVKFLFTKPLVKIGKLAITAYHPIVYDGEWVFPIDLLAKNCDNVSIINTQNTSSYVCNLFLDKDHTINVEGIQCITLAHGYENNILKHPFYGSKKVMNEFSKLKGWKDGLVKLKRYSCVKDENGLVCNTKVFEYDD